MEVFQLHNKKMKVLVGHQIAPTKLTRYKTAYEHGKDDLEDLTSGKSIRN